MKLKQFGKCRRRTRGRAEINLRCTLADDFAFRGNLPKINLPMLDVLLRETKDCRDYLAIVAVADAADEKLELLFV
jgi:hypothetical protein